MCIQFLQKIISERKYISIASKPQGIENGDVGEYYLRSEDLFDTGSHLYRSPCLFKKKMAHQLHQEPDTFKAKFLDWGPNSIKTVQLTQDDEVLITPILNGCSVAILEHKETHDLFACHLNYIHSERNITLFKKISSRVDDPVVPNIIKGEHEAAGGASVPVEEDPHYVHAPKVECETEGGGASAPAEKDPPYEYEVCHPDHYLIDEDESIRMFSSIPAGDTEEDFEEKEVLLPEKEQKVYIKHLERGWESKTFMEYGLPSGEMEGDIDPKEIMRQLHAKFPPERYNMLYHQSKKDYEALLHEISGYVSIIGIKDSEGQWSITLTIAGPEKAIVQTNPVQNHSDSALKQGRGGKKFT